MKALLVEVDDHGLVYQALKFWCPGCASTKMSGLHMLAVNSEEKKPAWDFDGNLELPTITPSILTRRIYKGKDFVCHSFLKAGVFEFLSDCTHDLKNQHVPIPDLPEWVTAPVTWEDEDE